MTEKEKHMCQWDKDERIRELDSYRAIVEKPKFMCQDCGRVAIKKIFLCKPLRLKTE